MCGRLLLFVYLWRKTILGRRIWFKSWAAVWWSELGTFLCLKVFRASLEHSLRIANHIHTVDKRRVLYWTHFHQWSDYKKHDIKRYRDRLNDQWRPVWPLYIDKIHCPSHALKFSFAPPDPSPRSHILRCQSPVCKSKSLATLVIVSMCKFMIHRFGKAQPRCCFPRISAEALEELLTVLGGACIQKRFLTQPAWESFWLSFLFSSRRSHCLPYLPTKWIFVNKDGVKSTLGFKGTF